MDNHVLIIVILLVFLAKRRLLMKVILKKITKFFEIKIGWFFINGNKKEKWNNYLNRKYFQQEN
jgi:hypothetical protein